MKVVKSKIEEMLQKTWDCAGGRFYEVDDDDDDEKKRCWEFLKIMKTLGMGSRQDFRPLHDFKIMTLFFKKKKKNLATKKVKNEGFSTPP